MAYKYAYEAAHPGSRDLAIQKLRKGRTDRINAIKNVPCHDCGKRYPPYVMDFDHRPDTLKRKYISQMRTDRWEDVLVEIDKCDVVCANCHRMRTWKRNHP